MAPTTQPRKLPSSAFQSPGVVQIYQEETRLGAYDLLPYEVYWRDRQPELEKRGYVLRNRYFKDWKPSWIDTTIHPDFCEDSIVLQVSGQDTAPHFHGSRSRDRN